MNQSKILRLASKPSWYAHAYSEYLADVAVQLSEFRAAIEECLDLESHSGDEFESILRSHGINPMARYIVGGTTPVDATTIVSYLWTCYNTDNIIENPPFDITPEQFCQDLFSEWNQSVVASKAFLSFAKSATDAIDRMTSFIQDVEVSIGISNEVRDTIEYYKSMIEQSVSVDDFVSIFTRVTGLDAAEETDSPDSYSTCDMTQFTGHTPGVALDFSTVSKAVDATVSVVASTVKSIFSLAKTGATWLFNKAKRYIVDTVVDPAVAEYIGTDQENSGYLDGFAYFGEFTPNAAYSHFQTGGQISEIFKGFSDEYASSWVKIELVTGEFIFKIVSDSVWQAYFKPIALDIQYLIDNCSLTNRVPEYKHDSHSDSIEEFANWLGSFVDYLQPVAKDATKDVLIAGYAFSYDLTSAIVHAALLETYQNVKGMSLSASTEYGKLSVKWSSYVAGNFSFTNATNKMLINAAAGNPGSSSNLHNYPAFSSVGVSLQSSVTQFACQTMITDVMSIWALCRIERSLFPTDYTFVPYSNNHSGFTKPSWKVKSDDEIAATRDNFLTIAITAVVIVVAAVFVGAMVAKIAKSIKFNRLSKLSSLNNKIFNGEKLSSVEKRRYLRYNRKLNASSLLNYGRTDSSSTSANMLQKLIDLIQG